MVKVFNVKKVVQFTLTYKEEIQDALHDALHDWNVCIPEKQDGSSTRDTEWFKNYLCQNSAQNINFKYPSTSHSGIYFSVSKAMQINVL